MGVLWVWDERGIGISMGFCFTEANDGRTTATDGDLRHSHKDREDERFVLIALLEKRAPGAHWHSVSYDTRPRIRSRIF